MIQATLIKWGVTALLCAAFGVACWVKGNAHGTQKLIDYQAKQATEAVRIGQGRAVVTERIITQYITKIVPQTKIVKETIEKEVIRYETANLDTCPLSVAAVSLHNSAAANTVPDSTKSVDGTASGLETTALTKTCTENYATYHQTANRLRGLQDWVKGQSVVK